MAPQHIRTVRLTYALLLTAILVIVCGCGGNKIVQVDDPQLKPIQAMLDKDLPAGVTEGTVLQFLSARGYPTEPPQKPGTIVAMIRHIDTQKLEPVTAKVTFYFDANGKLNTYEIVRTFNIQVSQ